MIKKVGVPMRAWPGRSTQTKISKLQLWLTLI